MKQFNLEEYLQNPSRRIITSDHRCVRIICTDRRDDIYPVVALIQDGSNESLCCYTSYGVSMNNIDSDNLFFAPIKKEGWVSIFKDSSGGIQLGRVYTSKKLAENMAKKCAFGPSYLTTVKLKWEE